MYETPRKEAAAVIFFTSICSNYLPKAMTLAESVKRHCPGATFVLCLVEREVPEVATNYPHFDEVILAKDAGWDDFDRFMFRHAIVEASTAVKAQFMLNLWNGFPRSRNLSTWIRTYWFTATCLNWSNYWTRSRSFCVRTCCVPATSTWKSAHSRTVATTWVSLASAGHKTHTRSLRGGPNAFSIFVTTTFAVASSPTSVGLTWPPAFSMYRC